MTLVWEKCDIFGVKVELENNMIKFPRQGDKWLMLLFVSFSWDANGKWKYVSNESNEDFELGVPIPDGSMMGIEHLSFHEAKETLGVFTCPAGSAKTQLLSMMEKGQKWIDRALESHLQRRDI